MYDPRREPGGAGVSPNYTETAAGKLLIDLFTKRSRDPAAQAGPVRKDKRGGAFEMAQEKMRERERNREKQRE